MRPDQLEAQLKARLDALPKAARAELLHVLMLPDLQRAERIGEFRVRWADVLRLTPCCARTLPTVSD